MLPDYLFLVVSLAIVIGFAVRAWNYGVVNAVWGVIGACGGLIGGFVVYRLVLADLEFGLPAKLALAFVAGLLVYFVVRGLVKWFLESLFEPNGALQFFVDGIGGVMLSLIPSLLTVAIIAGGLRIGGTLTELRRYEYLATPNRYLKASQYPEKPLATRWRDGMEAIPGFQQGIDGAGLLAPLPDRNLVGLLIVTKKPALKKHLEENLESQPIFEDELFIALLENESVKALNEAGNRVGLLQHSEVAAAVANPELRSRLEELELSRLVDDYLLSPEWQGIVESYEGGPNEF